MLIVLLPNLILKMDFKFIRKAYKVQEEREQYENYMQNEDETKATTLGDIFKDQLK